MTPGFRFSSHTHTVPSLCSHSKSSERVEKKNNITCRLVGKEAIFGWKKYIYFFFFKWQPFPQLNSESGSGSPCPHLAQEHLNTSGLSFPHQKAVSLPLHHFSDRYHRKSLGFHHWVKQTTVRLLDRSSTPVVFHLLSFVTKWGARVILIVRRNKLTSKTSDVCLFVNKTTQSPALIEKSSSFPASHAKSLLASIPAPPRRPVLWVTKACSTSTKLLFTYSYTYTSHAPNNIQLKISLPKTLDFSAFALIKPIMWTKTSLSSKLCITMLKFRVSKVFNL